MAQLGRISVPTLVDSGLTCPLTSDFGFAFGQDLAVGEVELSVDKSPGYVGITTSLALNGLCYPRLSFLIHNFP